MDNIISIKSSGKWLAITDFLAFEKNIKTAWETTRVPIFKMERLSAKEARKLFNQKKKRSKYNNEIVVYDGDKYDSIGEADYAKKLDWRLKAKEIKSWERQYRFSLIVNRVKVGTYIVDFKIVHNDDSIELVEYKGYKTELWKLKWAITKATLQDILPDSKLTLVNHK